MHCQPSLVAPAFAALLVLSGCGDAKNGAKPEATATPTQSGMAPMAGTGAPKPAVKAKSTGTITALDRTAGKVTLDHRAIPEANWPAMTMTFDAEPAILRSVKVGDNVAFDAEIAGSSGKVTAISKR
jgi:Cu(I)/Ag(I) efflux system protein CusF